MKGRRAPDGSSDRLAGRVASINLFAGAGREGAAQLGELW
jgi:hypothetical protein